MKNPFARLAVAAAIVVACVMGLFMWTGTQSSVALADVLARLQQVSVYMYQMSMTTTGLIGNDKALDQEIRATVLVSQDMGMKMTAQVNVGGANRHGSGPMATEAYMLPQQNRMVTIMPTLKQYIEIDLDGAAFEQQRKENNDPRAMVEQTLNCDYIPLGRSTIEGIEVEGFQTVDPDYLPGGVGEVDVKIWVDVRTRLPVRSEMDIQMGDKMHMRAVIHDFQWDVSVDASEFEPVIPDDYRAFAGGPLVMPDSSEEGAVEGLRRFAELSGRYPKKLDVMSFSSEMGEFAGQFHADKGPAEGQSIEEYVEQSTREMLNVMMPIQSSAIFYMFLAQEGKAPAYYGDIVGPEDADQVLMRWQVSETEYRVIFGSLHVETVSAEVLAELEKTLPQQ